MWAIIENLLREITLYVNEHPLAIRAVTGIVSAIGATVILMFRRKAASSGDWAKWFGLGLAVYALNYFIQAFLGYEVVKSAISPTVFEWTSRSVAAFSSGANNLFFLAAARSLRERMPVLPKLAWWFFGFGLISILPEWLCPFCRIPDALFSSYCLAWIGYAQATNISTRQQNANLLVALAILFAGAYVVVQFIHAINPILVWDKLPWIANLVSTFTQNSTHTDPLRFLDSLAIAALIPLKFGLFISGLWVLMREIIILSSATMKDMLGTVTTSRRNFITSGDFLKLVGNAVDACVVELVWLLPGRQKKKRILMSKWESGVEQSNLEEQRPIKIELVNMGNSVVMRVLSSGNEIIWRDGAEYEGRSFMKRLEGQGAQVKVAAVPIKFQGAVIGCLRVEAKGRRAFSATAMAHIRVLADLAALASQGERELAAADQFSSRYTEWRINRAVADMEPISDTEKDVKWVTEALQDILSPRAIILTYDIGFQQHLEIGGDSKQAALLRLYGDNGCKYDELVEKLKATYADTLDVLEIDLEAGEIGKIGKLALVVTAGYDDAEYPTWGTNYLLRKTIGALVADILPDITRDRLGFVERDFSIGLSQQEVISLQSWFASLEKAAKDARLLWAVVTDLADQDILGEKQWTDLVQGIRSEACDLPEEPSKRDLPEPVGGTYHVITFSLPNTKSRVWFGVGRTGFGAELQTSSPWAIFLEHLCELADAALVQMTAAMDLQQEHLETAKAQGLATAAVTAETLFHQLMNMVRDIANPIATIHEALLMNLLKTDDEIAALIRATSRSANRLMDFASEFMKITKLGTDRPCSLLEAVNQSKLLFEHSLQHNQIELVIEVDPELSIDVPFHVASLAIANLVANAKDAIGSRGGFIRIEASEEGGTVYCLVADNGPGIHPSVRDRLFKIGGTTKTGSGGWGLYLVKRSLIENGSNIKLDYNGGGARRS